MIFGLKLKKSSKKSKNINLSTYTRMMMFINVDNSLDEILNQKFVYNFLFIHHVNDFYPLDLFVCYYINHNNL
jgi:hypothetical protein